MTWCLSTSTYGTFTGTLAQNTACVAYVLLHPHLLVWYLQSFDFLVDVSEFKNDLVLGAAANDNNNEKTTTKYFGGFGGYLAIVNDYIKDCSHSEVNIDSKKKRDILQFANFKAYTMLDLVRELERVRDRVREKDIF